MTRRRDLGRITPVDESLEADMHVMAREMLQANGFQQYEISNWCKPSQECRHNLVYWTNGNWWPVGPGASGHVDGLRWKNEARLGTYVDGTGRPVATHVERGDDDVRMGEAFMMGLRLRRGIPSALLESMLSCGTEGGRRRRML